MARHRRKVTNGRDNRNDAASEVRNEMETDKEL